jgi:centrosomal CEP192-like protein/ASPM-SPD-2-Hydin domain-containing protein
MSQIQFHPGLEDTQRALARENHYRNSSHRIQVNRLSYFLLALVVLGGCISLAGCGGVVANPASNASTGSLTATPGSVQFTSVNVGNSATSQVSLVNSSASAVAVTKLASSNSSFTVDGEGTLPVTVAAGASVKLNVHFIPTIPGQITGALTITSGSLTDPSLTIQLGGTGLPPLTPALSALSCTSSSASGAGTDACTVTLSAEAPLSGFAVNLSSNNLAVTIPASVTVPGNATSVGFTATIAAVSIAETATLTSTASGASQTFALSLSPQVASGPTGPSLSVNSSTVSFGNVAVGTPSTQSVTLTSNGTAAVTVNSASLSGTGFTESGATFPLTLNAGQTATLSLQFEPTATGAATGKLTITSNASSNSTAVVALSGTGVPLAVDLSWSAPSTTSGITGYNVYRASGTSSSYAKLNSSVNSPASFMDSTVAAGTTYEYYVTSVDSTGTESTPSNTATVVVP